MSKVMSAAQIMHEIEAIKGYLTAAGDVVKSGHMPELVGLEERMAFLCEAIKKSTPETQETCLLHLPLILEQLNTCENAMRELHGKQSAESKAP